MWRITTKATTNTHIANAQMAFASFVCSIDVSRFEPSMVGINELLYFHYTTHRNDRNDNFISQRNFHKIDDAERVTHRHHHLAIHIICSSCEPVLYLYVHAIRFDNNDRVKIFANTHRNIAGDKLLTLRITAHTHFSYAMINKIEYAVQRFFCIVRCSFYTRMTSAPSAIAIWFLPILLLLTYACFVWYCRHWNTYIQ